MYFMHDNGDVEVVPEKPPHKSYVDQATHHVVISIDRWPNRYYLIRSGLTSSGQQQKVEAFPPGFQMLAGNSFKRKSVLSNPDPTPLGPWPSSTQEERAQRALGFTCLHYAAGHNEPSLGRHELPTKEFMDANCADGIRLEIFFPSCWNGELDSEPLHNSHVVYPDGVQVGNCPKGFDRRLVSLFYETIVATEQFKGKPGKFLLANGDPTGYGYHGDFIAAWKGDTLANAIEQCDGQAPSGNMRACPLFTMTKNSGTCQMETPVLPAIQHENVKGPMKGLANGLQVFYGPDPAPNPDAEQGKKVPVKLVGPNVVVAHEKLVVIPSHTASPESRPTPAKTHPPPSTVHSTTTKTVATLRPKQTYPISTKTSTSTAFKDILSGVEDNVEKTIRKILVIEEVAVVVVVDDDDDDDKRPPSVHPVVLPNPNIHIGKHILPAREESKLGKPWKPWGGKVSFPKHPPHGPPRRRWVRRHNHA